MKAGVVILTFNVHQVNNNIPRAVTKVRCKYILYFMQISLVNVDVVFFSNFS